MQGGGVRVFHTGLGETEGETQRSEARRKRSIAKIRESWKTS